MEMINKELECGICLEICYEAVETSCCNNLYCQKCISGIKNCPTCRVHNFRLYPSKVARRMISKLPAQCKHCEDEMERGLLGTHKLQCDALEHKCSVENCGFAALKDDFVEHIWTAHETHLIKCFSTSLDGNESLPSKAVAVSTNSPDIQRLAFEYLKKNGLTNSAGRNALLNGKNFKFYCQGPLANCGCRYPTPNGCRANKCGPNGGCNCRECMKLDIKLRRLQKGHYVNKSGRIAQSRNAPMNCMDCSLGRKTLSQCRPCTSLLGQVLQGGMYSNLYE